MRTAQNSVNKPSQIGQQSHSGVYPSSGPHPKGDVPIRREMEWGQGELGAATYQDHGKSELSSLGNAITGGLAQDWAAILCECMPSGCGETEVPLRLWPVFCDWFTRTYPAIRTTVLTDDRAKARRLPLVGVGAQVLEEHVGIINVHLARKPNDFFINVTPKNLVYCQRSAGVPEWLRIITEHGNVVLSFEVGI